MTSAKVSVCLITYNHELFISAALDSILSQKTSFSFEIIISNDLSSDNTEKIIIEYKDKYPDKIKYLNTNKRLGVIKNWLKCLNAANGDYVAVIEGDDYWTSEQKLQKQFELMEANPAYSFCFHKLKMKFERADNIDEYLNQNLTKNEFTIEDIITQKWFIGTCSIFYRRSCLSANLNWVKKLDMIDKPIQLMLALNGNIGLIDEYMGVYRIHNSGASQIQWLGKERIFEKSLIKVFTGFNIFSHYMYSDIIYPIIYKCYYALFEKNKEYKKDFLCIRFDFLIFRIKKYIRLKFNILYK
jgi:glycosyltransferase involved in cell wall biosynthesis